MNDESCEGRMTVIIKNIITSNKNEFVIKVYFFAFFYSHWLERMCLLMIDPSNVSREVWLMEPLETNVIWGRKKIDFYVETKNYVQYVLSTSLNSSENSLNSITVLDFILLLVNFFFTEY